MESIEELDKDKTIQLDNTHKDVSSQDNNVNEMINKNINASLTSMITQIESELLSSDKKKEISSTIINNATDTISSTFTNKLTEYFAFPKKYFDLNTTDVRRRLIYSFIPFNSEFYEIAKTTPDLYGPFWILTTIAFLIACACVVSTMNDTTIKEFQEVFPIAGTVVYSFGFIMSLIAYLCLMLIGEPCSIVSCICLYGYALSVFIPALIVCCFKFELARWILLIYAGLASSFFLIVNLQKATQRLESKMKVVLFGIVVFGQVLMFAVLRFHFFSTTK